MLYKTNNGYTLEIKEALIVHSGPEIFFNTRKGARIFFKEIWHLEQFLLTKAQFLGYVKIISGPKMTWG